MVGGRGHHMVEVAIRIGGIALGDNSLQSCRCLFEGKPRGISAALEIPQPEAEAEHGVAV